MEGLKLRYELSLRTSPRRLIWCSSFLAAKDHASTHSPCCASLNPSPQAAPTVRLKVSLRSMLSCLLLWLRHPSRQLLCSASRFVQSSFSTLHFVSFAIHHSCSLRLGFEPARHSTHLTTTCTRFQHQAYSTPFRFVHSSFTQQAAVHPLPLLCSPALSSGLRAVMIFAPPLVG